MTAEPSLPAKIVAVHDALDAAFVAHAFGGALALAYYAEPRATVDIDLNLFTGADRLATVTAALIPLGVQALVDRAMVDRDGQARVWWGRTPVDLFFAYDPLHDAMRDAARVVPFGERRIPVLSAEHLVVCKVVFDRPKDWLDIEQVMTCVPQLDVGEIREWLGRLTGDVDLRAQRFDETAGRLLRR